MVKKYTQLEPSASGLAESWKRERRYPDALFKKGGLSYGSGDNFLDTRRIRAGLKQEFGTDVYIILDLQYRFEVYILRWILKNGNFFW